MWVWQRLVRESASASTRDLTVGDCVPTTMGCLGQADCGKWLSRASRSVTGGLFLFLSREPVKGKGMNVCGGGWRNFRRPTRAWLGGQIAL